MNNFTAPKTDDTERKNKHHFKINKFNSLLLLKVKKKMSYLHSIAFK